MRHLLLAAALLLPVTAWSQDLAAAAQKEKERRAATKARQGRVYTDEDLPESASPSPKPVKAEPSKPTAKKVAPVSPPEPEAVEEQEEGTDTESMDARYRRLAAPIKERLDQCHASLEDTQQALAAAQKRVDEMRGIFTDEEKWAQAREATAEGEWAKARVAELKAEAARIKHDCDEIEDEGRRARIPPGYLR